MLQLKEVQTSAIDSSVNYIWNLDGLTYESRLVFRPPSDAIEQQWLRPLNDLVAHGDVENVWDEIPSTSGETPE